MTVYEHQNCVSSIAVLVFEHQRNEVVSYLVARAYRAAEGGERACNSRTSCIEGEMLAVTKFKSRNDAV